MILASCSNCCFNGLQYGSVGLSIGYCVEHRQILRHADETTCGRHFRKDLPRAIADGFNQRHRTHFNDNAIFQIRSKKDVTSDPSFTENDPSSLFGDATGSVVAEYGIDAKIAALASLRRTPGARAELALLSLGRAYVRRCTLRGGSWTSGLHILWWTKERLAAPPKLEISEFRYQTQTSLERQEELAVWSLVMLRLTMVSDIGAAAAEANHEIGTVAPFVEEAAERASTDLTKLLRWVTKTAVPVLSKVLSWDKYSKIREGLGSEA